MFRFKQKHRFKKQVFRSVAWIGTHGIWLFLTCLMIIGTFLGTLTFCLLSEDQRSLVTEWIYSMDMPSDFAVGCQAVLSASLVHLLLLLMMFLFGITAFGCPLILFAVTLFGFRLGVMECQMYVRGGFLQALICTHIPLLITACAVLIAAKQSLTMSCVFSRQLLPFGAHCGGLWTQFRRFLLYYTICFGLVIVSAIAEVLFRVIGF